MTTFHRALLAMLFAAWLAMPSVGDEGGENASGGGVWILPCAAVVDEESLENGPVAGSQRGSLASHSIATDVRMQMASNMGSASAVMVSALTSDPLPLQIDGSSVVLTRQLLQALAIGKTEAQILIVDAQHNGYIIDLKFNSAGTEVSLGIR